MKIKTWVIWLVVLVFLASEAFLFSANRQKQAALTQLSEARQQVDDLQSQLDQLKNSSASSQAAEISRLRADNLDLPRLRNQVTQLQAANKKLNQQLNATLTTAQQQQAQLQQIAEANQQAQADADRDTCINNLRQIDAAKQQWALEHGKNAASVPTVQDLTPYFKDGVFPVCPSGGTYTLNAVGELPSCSVPGHVLPQ